MNKNETVLLNLLKKTLFGTEVVFPADTDWEGVKEEAAAQTVLALAAASVPEAESAKWRESSAQSTAHYMRVLYEQTNLVKLFSANHIPFVILKGTAAAMYYPNPKLRTMGDIDFIVAEKDFESAKAVLDENGYVFEHDYQDGRESLYRKGGVDFELHYRYSERRYNFESVIRDGLECAVTHTLNGHSFPTLPDYGNGLVILDHLRHHLRRGLGLRQVVDWAMFVNRVLTDENYTEHFLPLIEEVGLVPFCETVTKACKIYLGLPDTFTWCDNADTETADELMEFVMRNGNFGIKERGIETGPMKGLVFDMKRNGFFRTLQWIGIDNFPICQKNRFFRAFAWLFQLFRFAWQGCVSLLRGKNLIKEASDGNKQADLYSRLGLR